MQIEKRFGIALALAAALSLGGAVFAEESSTGDTGTVDTTVKTETTITAPSPEELRAKMEARAREAREAAEKKRAEAETKRVEFQTKKASTTEMIKDRREEFQVKRASTTEALKERREELEAKRASTTEMLKQKREEVRNNLEEKRKENIRAHANRMSERFGAAFDRLDTLAGRIEERLAKLESVNKNIQTASAHALVEDALLKIDEGRLLLENLSGEIELALASEDPKAAFTDVRESTNEVAAMVKEAHKLLVDAVKSIKANTPDELENDDDDESGSGETATSTATTTAQ